MQRVFVQCEKCGASLGAPRGMGMLQMTCRKCGHQFLFDSNVPTNYGAVARSGLSAKKRRRRRALPAALLLCAVLIAALALWRGGGPSALPEFFSGLSAQADPSGGTPSQGGSPDTGTPNPGSPGAGSPGAGSPDAGSPDAGSPDAGLPDAGTPDPGTAGSGRNSPAYEQAKTVIPYLDLRYFFSAMNEGELEAARIVYEAAMDFETSCSFSGGSSLDTERFTQLMDVLEAECPELFQLDWLGGYQYSYDQITGLVTGCQLNYRFTQTEYQDMRQDCEAVIDGYVSATQGLTDVEKEKYVFDDIASNCWYRVDDTYADTAYGALVSRAAKCDGFSGAVKWSMEAMGIQCLEVSGMPVNGDSIGHAWNIIRLDGRYCLLDVTQSVHNETDPDAGIDDIIYYVFNGFDALESDYEVYDFFPAFAPVPRCEAADLCFYAQAGAFVPKGGDPAAVMKPQLEAVAANGGGVICVQFEDQAAYDAFISRDCQEILGDFLSGLGQSYRFQTSQKLLTCAINVELY